MGSISYGEAKAGKVRIAAVQKNPAEPALVKVKAALVSDGSINGSKEIPVVEQTLKIVMEGERKVEPMNLKGLRTPQKPKEQNKKEFTVQLTRNKAAVQNYPFLLSNKNVDRSGGHDHVNARPAGTQEQRRDNYGYYILKRTNDAIDVRPYNGQTQEDGKEKFEYVASVFGDRMLLRVETTEPNKKKFLWDTLSVVEKVDGLQLLGEGTNYRLVGGTCNHHGPSDRGIVGNCQTPNNNHWGTTTLIQVVQTVADSFVAKYPGYRLRINDMSLPFGGKFEINGTWDATVDHQEHRKGTNADIALTGYNPNGQEVGLNQRQRRRLWDLISDASGRDPLDETDRNHYHIQ